MREFIAPKGRTGRLVTVTALGALLRLAAFCYNDLPHGDIHTDYQAAWSLFASGQLSAPFGINHPPLWPFLGGMGAHLLRDPFVVFKALSLLAGVALVPLGYWAFRKPFGENAAFLASACIALSYILTDFSGNGSLYSLQAFPYLLFVALCANPHRWRNSLLLGWVAGLAYLLNYQAVIVLVALIAVYLGDHRVGDRSWGKRPFLLSVACAAVTVLPLFIGKAILLVSPSTTQTQDTLLGGWRSSRASASPGPSHFGLRATSATWQCGC